MKKTKYNQEVFSPENRAVNEVMWVGGTVRQDSDVNITLRMRFASWITMATNTH